MYISPITPNNITYPKLSFRGNNNAHFAAEKADTFEHTEPEIQFDMCYVNFDKHLGLVHFINDVLSKYTDLYPDRDLIPKKVIYAPIGRKEVEASYVSYVGDDADEDLKAFEGSLIINKNYFDNLDYSIKSNIKNMKLLGLYEKNKEGKVSFSILDDFQETKRLRQLAEKFERKKNSLSDMQKWELSVGIKSIIDQVKYVCNYEDPPVIKHLNIHTPKKTVLHELGHIRHQKEYEFFDDLAEPAAYRLEEVPFLSAEFAKNPLKQKFAEFVSSNALISPGEFVADVYAYLLSGEVYSDEIMELYYSYGGPVVEKTIS